MKELYTIAEKTKLLREKTRNIIKNKEQELIELKQLFEFYDSVINLTMITDSVVSQLHELRDEFYDFKKVG